MRCLAAIAVATLLALTACAPLQLVAPPPTTAPDLEPTWTTDEPTLGTVETIDDVVLAYVSPAEGVLELQAWDRDTGELQWHAEASPAAMAMGIALAPMVFEQDGVGYVAFVAPAPSGYHRITLLVAEDGSAVPFEGADEDMWVEERPGPCPDTGRPNPEVGACFAAASAASNGVTQQLRIDANGLTPMPDAGATDHGRGIGPDLYATNDRGPGAERIEYVVGGVLEWSVAYHDVFGPGYTSDNGWSWERDDDRGLMIGFASLGHDGDTLDLASVTTVALSLDDGSVVWRAEGVELWCATGEHTPDVGCRYDDTVIEYHSDEPGDATVVEGSIDVVRLDLDTGEVLWEVPVGDWLGAGWQLHGFAHDDEEALIMQEGEPVLLDLADGTTTRADWPTLPCTTSVYYDYAEWTVADADLVPYLGGDAMFACDVDRAVVVDATLPGDWVTLAGTFLGTHNDMHDEFERWVLPTADGLAMYEVPSTS